jgi:hypothetical protein
VIRDDDDDDDDDIPMISVFIWHILERTSILCSGKTKIKNNIVVFSSVFSSGPVLLQQKA